MNTWQFYDYSWTESSTSIVASVTIVWYLIFDHKDQY